jgi:hypothetical protein
MSTEKKILEELRRFNQINSYLLKEQPEVPPAPEDVPPAPDAVAPDAGEVAPDPAMAGADPAMGAPDPATAGADAAAVPPPAGGEAIPEPIDIENDPDVEEVGAETPEDAETEEIDITDLVTSQQEIQAKQDEFMDNMFTKLDDLASKLENMDQIMTKINDLETKFDKYREKTPEEKLMLRSLDSYPYNQKLTDFFQDKEEEMEKTGKNEYVLTSDEVENFSPNEVKKTFNIYDKEEDNM